MDSSEQPINNAQSYLPEDSLLREEVCHLPPPLCLLSKCSWLVWLVGKYLAGRSRVHAGTSLWLAVLGILIGVATLIAVLTGMSGMQSLLTDSIDEVTAYHLQVIVNSEADSLTVQNRLRQDSFVHNITRYREAPMLLSSKYTDPVVAIVRAVEVPDFMADDGRKAVMQSMGPLLQSDLDNPRHLWVGRTFSLEHNFGEGDFIQVISAEYSGSRIEAKQNEFLVSSAYQLGNPSIESNYVFIGLNRESEKLFYSNEYYLGLKLQNKARAEAVKSKVSEQLQAMQEAGEISQFQLRTGREANRAFFNALHTEKAFLQVLVSLIFIVVAFQIFQSTRRSIFSRIPELMLLRALGAATIRLRCIFVMESFFVGFLGVSFGTALGVLISTHMNEILFGISRLLFRAPGMLPTISTEISWLDLLLVVGSALVFSSTAGCLATRRLLHIQPIEVLRHE